MNYEKEISVMESVKDYLGRFFVGHGDEKEEEN